MSFPGAVVVDKRGVGGCEDMWIICCKRSVRSAPLNIQDPIGRGVEDGGAVAVWRGCEFRTRKKNYRANALATNDYEMSPRLVFSFGFEFVKGKVTEKYAVFFRASTSVS